MNLKWTAKNKKKKMVCRNQIIFFFFNIYIRQCVSEKQNNKKTCSYKKKRKEHIMENVLFLFFLFNQFISSFLFPLLFYIANTAASIVPIVSVRTDPKFFAKWISWLSSLLEWVALDAKTDDKIFNWIE